jgi:hypothetical protein
MEEILQFLSSHGEISFGFTEFNLFSPEDLEDEQVGYSRRPDGSSLVTGEPGRWREEWLVIGDNQLGDPIFVDRSSSQLTVLTAGHGMGRWDAFIIADSLRNFSAILDRLRTMAVGREDPVALENNPVSEDEQNGFLKFVESNNPRSEISFWEVLFEID